MLHNFKRIATASGFYHEIRWNLAFLDSADLSEYDLSEMKPIKFEYLRKSAKLNMRLPESLLAAIKAKADAQGIPYQRYIRQVLETDVGA
jgi:predicted DNA binding CopG/RHH family protein